MKYDKSLKEVWEWKDKAYERTKGLTMAEMVKKIEENASALCKKYNLHLKKLHPSHK